MDMRIPDNNCTCDRSDPTLKKIVPVKIYDFVITDEQTRNSS
jgi:hypothetical protein